jgi:signal transduction histidine kinase
MGQPPVPEEHVATLAVRVDGRTRGYLYINWIILNIPDDVQSIVSDQITRGLVALVFLGGILTISAGIIASRSLTAPLSRLAQAAHEFGTMGLNRRVEIRGSVEVVAVANALNEMAAALENAEMLRRNLVADVAHELRTPLTVLRANLQAILDDVYPLNKNELQSLMEQTELLSHLVNDLHELAQVEAKQLPLALDAVDLSTFVDSVAKNFKPVVEAHDVTLTVQTPSSPVMVLADVSRLQQVLNNLLDNALRHTPAGGSITLLLTEETALAHLTVQDSGSGIPAEHLPHVFERFYRVDRSRSRITGGTGLGLTIAKAIVEMHGGHIKVSSSEIPGQGAAFTVSLPRSLP